MWEPGQKIDNQFVVLDRFAGGMGIVFVVLDELTHHKFAVKTLKPELIANPTAIDRFRQEARTWLSLGHHPNLVYAAVYREIDGVPLLFIEYVDGVSLADLLRIERVLFLPQALAFAMQICEGMEYLHSLRTPTGEEGIIHRDLKPANVLINRQCVAKVTDFGLAKIHGDISALAEGRRGVGTYSYMPPEQVLDAASADRRSDVYSFGATLYHMVAGRPPVDGETTSTVVASILRGSPAPPSSINPEVPPALDSLILRCLARQRGDRFTSFREVRQALSEIEVEGEGRRRSGQRCSNCGYLPRLHYDACPVCAGKLAVAKAGAPPPQEKAGEVAAGEAAAQLAARALEHRDAGRFDQAIVLLRQAANLAPDDASISRALDETALLAARHQARGPQRHYNWPVEGGNLNRLGFTPEVVAPPLRVAWTTSVADWIAAAPVVANGRVYVGGYVEEAGRHGRLCALRLSDGAILWELRAQKEFVAAACVVGGRMLFVPSGPRLAAVDCETGRPLWEVEIGADIYGGPVTVQNLVLVTSAAGEVSALGAQTGQRVWRFTADGPVLGGATASEDMVWVGSSDYHVYALDLHSGKVLWTYVTGGEVQVPCAYVRGSLLVASLDQRVHCIHALDGRRRWEFRTDGEIHTSPAACENTVVVGTRGKSAFGIALDSGHAKWRFAARDWIDSSPVISGRTVYFGSHDGHVYALERESGILLWRQDLQCEITAAPAVSAGYVVIAGRDGRVYGLKSRA
ncbi:MAG: PQQ-binding-like beta-propeller repeat protein [Armatimonadetes bacterium]|nr:PQQ-binding-like beta-propeller repeat protein [Armatimonadota bacterium]